MEPETLLPRGLRNIGSIAASAGGITLLCLLVGTTAEQYVAITAPVSGPEVLAAAAPKPQFNTIDFATTGSIKGGQTVVISPCTGQKIGP